MPDNLYPHSGSVQTGAIGLDLPAKREALRPTTRDRTTALTIHTVWIDKGHLRLEPLPGSPLAPILSGVALPGAGLKSTLIASVTVTMAGQIVREGFINLAPPRWLPGLRKLITAAIMALNVICYPPVIWAKPSSFCDMVNSHLKRKVLDVSGIGTMLPVGQTLLTGLHKIHWVVTGVASLAYGGLMVFPDQMQILVAQAAFRPTFTLPVAEGHLRTSADLAGRHLLMVFAANCPDVRPATLADVGQVIDCLGDDVASVHPLFISIAPERDRRLGHVAYTTAFHPSILRLAGGAAQTCAAADSFEIVCEPKDSAAAPDGCMRAHSPALDLIGPDRDWLRQFPCDTPAAEFPPTFNLDCETP